MHKYDKHANILHKSTKITDTVLKQHNTTFLAEAFRTLTRKRKKKSI